MFGPSLDHVWTMWAMLGLISDMFQRGLNMLQTCLGSLNIFLDTFQPCLILTTTATTAQNYNKLTENPTVKPWGYFVQ